MIVITTKSSTKVKPGLFQSRFMLLPVQGPMNADTPV